VTDRPAPSGLDRLADLLLFAPIGLVTEASEAVPDLAERGRRRVRSQVALARFVGEVAVRQAEQAMEAWTERHRRVPEEEPVAAAGPAPSVPDDGPDVVIAPMGPVPAAADLALADYDTLAAAQVIVRLEGLDPQQRAAIGRYEQAHRGRKTILGKISQLS
jgi:hypothetical protein